jgi:hypothetical protein
MAIELSPELNFSRRHCEERSDEAIQFFSWLSGLLRFARNDGEAFSPIAVS